MWQGYRAFPAAQTAKRKRKSFYSWCCRYRQERTCKSLCSCIQKGIHQYFVFQI
ncbi:MAG: hypothetical protein ACI4J1_01605 [Ruminiclostridium sp.]